MMSLALAALGRRMLLGLAVIGLSSGCAQATGNGDGGVCVWTSPDAGTCSAGLSADAGAPSVDSLSGATVYRNLTYGVRGGYALPGDLWLPDGVADSGTRSGVMVLIHGGEASEWGDCGRRRDALDGYAQTQSAAVKVAAFNIDYRLPQEGGSYPEDVSDVICATEWISAHAGDYGLDGSRVVLVGESAGGQLALLAALEHNLPSHDPKCGPMPAIRGVLTYSAPTDLPTLVASKAPAAASAQAYAGDCADPVPTCDVGSSCDTCIDASPTAHACVGGASQTDFLLVHAPDPFDGVVPVSQAQILADDFGVSGVPVSLFVPSSSDLQTQGCAAGTSSAKAHGLLNTCLSGASSSVVNPFLEQEIGPK